MPRLAPCLLFVLAACTTMPREDPALPALDRDLAALVANPEQPLLAVAALAIRDGRVVYRNQFGRRFVDAAQPSRDLPVTERTLFRIASVSKLVVALGVMRLVEAGRLELDADVSALLGWTLRNPHHPQEPITLRLLLSHRSSLSDGDGSYSWDGDVRLLSVLQPGGARYREGLHWQRDHAPGTWFAYSNLNFGVVAQAMERASGERFDRLMQRLVLGPLGLRGGFNPADFTAADQRDVATLYRKRHDTDGREVWQPDGPWVVQADDFQRQPAAPPAGSERYVVGDNGTLFGPQGRLRISLSDLGTVMQMLLAEGRHDGRPFLGPESVRLLASEQWRMNPASPNGQADKDWARSWGLGGQRFTDHSAPGRGDRLVEDGGFSGWGHLGDAYGVMATFALDPVKKQGVVVIAAGPGVDPDSYPSRWSAMYRWQELATSATIRRALWGLSD